MDIRKWSFQLLLEVFSNYVNDGPGDKIVSPIVSETFLRHENTVLDYPFEFTYIDSQCDDGKRYSADGIFKHDGDNLTLDVNFIDDSICLTQNDIMTIITRDKLMTC